MATPQLKRIDLGLTQTEYNETRRAILELETDKGGRGGVRASATVYWVGRMAKSHVFGVTGDGCNDFRRTIAEDRSTRATQKAIDSMHFSTFTDEAVQALTDEAKAFYAGRDRVTQEVSANA